MKAQQKPYYSGERSRAFWHRIDRLHITQHSRVKREEAYSLGCMLQVLEKFVLNKIASLENNKAK